MQNPWANGPEWTGPCCDTDEDFWTNPTKDAFNEKDGEEDNERQKHQWYHDDGIFCMRAEDVLEYFTVLVVVRDYPKNYHAVEFSQEWNVKTGGFMETMEALERKKNKSGKSELK
jgi:hypothetical protein